jgi:hypothetical protein
MNATELVHEIKVYCTENADAERVKKSQRYFKEEFVGYGLMAPQVYAKVKDLLNTKAFDLHVVLEAMPAFMESGKYEEISKPYSSCCRQWTRAAKTARSARS